jgi:hypothetical protein
MPAQVVPTLAAMAEVYGLPRDNAGLDTMVSLLYGDEAADRLGWHALGLRDRPGYAVGLDHHLQRRDQHGGLTAEVRA